MPSGRSAGKARPFASIHRGPSLGRRELLAGGIGAGALIALPDFWRTDSRGARSPVSGNSAGRHVFLYGVLQSGSPPGGSVAATVSPTSRSGSLPAAVPVASNLATAPVLSPDQATVALVTVTSVSGGAQVTLTLVGTASAAIAKQGSIAITGIPEGTNILTTPVFAAGSTTIALVLAITEPAGQRQISKRDPRTDRVVIRSATTWKTHHALAYFDAGTGSFTGPFHLADQPSLALSTAVA